MQLAPSTAILLPRPRAVKANSVLGASFMKGSVLTQTGSFCAGVEVSFAASRVIVWAKTAESAE
jgi:hypothetical protein